MASIFITSAYQFDPKENFAAEWLKESAQADPFKIHRITDRPEEADLILFVEHHPPHDPYFFKILHHDFIKRFPEKCYLYHDSDYVIPFIKGIYPSIEKRYYHENICRSGPYIARLCQNEAVYFRTEKPEPEFLFSFVGASRTHIVRKEILKLKYSQSFLKDTSNKNLWQLSLQEKEEFSSCYADVSLRSKFVLCPRGFGPNTYRLYETMEMGIAPIIISDEWVPMKGPDWQSFSIKVLENQVAEIPSILKSYEHLAEEMGRKARLEWEKWFSKKVAFHHIAGLCAEISRLREKESLLSKLRVYSQFLRPFHFRNYLRYKKNQLIKNR